MALVLKDRVKETTVVTSTGTATLLGAQLGYQSFNTAVPSGSVVYYCIAGQGTNEWEVGYGTFTSPNQLSRTSVYDSSSAGALVNFSAGTKDVFITYPAEQAVYQETNGDLRLINGVIEVSLDGTSSAGNALPNVSFQAFSTINSYMQANQQNYSSGNSASSDYVVTADNGNDTENYFDMGMGSSGYNYPEFSGSKANDAYLLNAGNNLVLISGKYGANSSNLSNTSDIVFVAGSFLDTEERMRIKSATGNVILSSAANPTDNGQKLQVVGDADVSANATVGGTIVIEGGAYSNASMTSPDLNQLVTKAYVDGATAAGLHIHQPVTVATTGNLVAIYNQPNGAGNGVGATLTNNTTQATITIDSTVLSANNRVLVYQQSNAVQNGVYVVTNTGSNSTNWVLTRSSDTDTSSQNDPNSLGGGDYFYVIDGDTQAGDSYVCTSEGNISFGTTLITFSQFSAAPEYIGAAPINVSGQTIALTGIVDVTHGGTNISSYTAGDILYASNASTINKLALGTSGQALIVSGSSPAWGSIDLAGNVTGTLTADHGGTGISSYTQGDMLYANGSTSIDKIVGNTTTTKKFLSQTGTGTAAQAPIWAQPAASDITGLAPSATTDTSNASNITSGTLPAGRLTGEYTGVSGVGVLANGTWTANTIAVSYGGTGATSASDARTNLGLTIGANVQAYSLQLDSLAAVSSNGMLARSASNTVTPRTITAGDTITVTNGDGSAGNPTIAFSVAPGTANNVLVSNGTAWTSDIAPPAKASGGGAIWVNNQTVSANVTINTGQNGLMVGPMIVANGISITIASGQRLVVI